VAGFIPDPVRARMLGTLLGGGTATFATTIYFGVLTFGAVAAALGRGLPRAARLAFGLGVLAVLLALGGHLGLLTALQSVLPLLAKFRYPERYLALVWVAMLWVVPLGYERALAGEHRRFWAGAGTAAALNLLLGLPFGASLVWALRGASADPELAEAVGSAWRASATLGVAVAALGSLALLLRKPSWRWGLFAALAFADLWRGNAAHLPLVDVAAFERSPFASALQAQGTPPPRVVSLVKRQWPSGVGLPGREAWVRATLGRLRASSAELSGVEALDSNLGLLQRRHTLVFGPRDEALAAVGGFFNACDAVVDANAAPADEDGPLPMTLQPMPCWPRAFLAEATPAASTDEAVRMVQQLKLEEPRVPWEGGPALARSEGTLKWLEYAGERRALEVETPAAAALVVTDDFIPGWHASVDGAEVAIHPAMVTALGVEVPAGKHRVELSYRTPRLLPGALLTLLALIALLGTLFRREKALVSPSS